MVKGYAGYITMQGCEVDIILIEEETNLDSRIKSQFGKNAKYELSEIDLTTVPISALTTQDISNLDKIS